jgi:hypothetical protein
MRWMVWLHGISQKLGGKEVKMIVNWLELALLVKVIHGCRCMAASYCAQGVVLSNLDFFNPGLANEWFPQGSKITDDRHDGDFLGHESILHGETPAVVGDGFDDFCSRRYFGQLMDGVSIIHTMRVKDMT